MSKVAITGNTFPVKDKLKSLGGTWDGQRKCWLVPADKEADAKAIVQGAGPKKAFSGGGSYGARSGGYQRRGDGGPRGDRKCYMCGSLYCEGARGGLCEDD